MEFSASRIVEALPGLIWTAHADGRIDFLNRRWCHYTGLSLEEAADLGWQSAILPEDLPQLLERWRAIVGTGHAGEIEQLHQQPRLGGPAILSESSRGLLKGAHE